MADKKDTRRFEAGRTMTTYQPRPAGSATTQPVPAVPQAKLSRRQIAKRTLVSLALIILATVVFIGGWDMINISRAAQKTFGSGNIFSALTPTDLKSSSGHVNILLVGYSADDPGHPGATLTDSIILMSLNTTKHSGYMLSIPRDLCVDIPGYDVYGCSKINEAYKDGGIALLEQIVVSDFNTPINYYALVDYAAVRDTVSALGGVWVNIQSPDPRGLYDPNINITDGGPLKLADGWQKLNGQTALNLTRARGDSPDAYGFSQSDFDRTQHQRQVIDAIKQKLGWTLVLNPLKNGKLFSAVDTNVKTDISVSEARPLFSLFKNIPQSQLQSLSLNSLDGKDYLRSYETYSGESALVPAAGLSDYSQIDAAISGLNQN